MPLLPTITDLNARLSRGETTCEALVDDALARAATPAAHAVFTKLYPDAARAAARAADAARAAGVALPPLAGLPVTIKDLYDVAGETTLAGSIVWRDQPPAASDCPAVARLRGAGSAIVGKTNMTEFAFSGVGINPHYGTPVNPADPRGGRIPGGSSSGAAVSVALGLAVAGLGSDTGGSIRIPAAVHGIVGFKATQSRVPRTGAAELSRTLDTVCAMTRDVTDALLVDAVLAGAPLPVRRRPLAGLRLAVPRTLMFDGIEPEVARAFDRAVTALSAAGALLVDLPLTELGEIAALNQPAGFSPMESYAIHRERIASRRAEYDPRVAVRIELGAKAGAADYVRLHDRRAEWIARVEARLEAFDALLCPTLPILAPTIEAAGASDDEFARINALLLRNTSPINFLDGCSFSLPCQAPGEAPVGLMLSSVRGDDARLAAVALAVEAALAGVVGGA